MFIGRWDDKDGLAAADSVEHVAHAALLWNQYAFLH